MEANLSMFVIILISVAVVHISGSEIEDVRIQGEANSTYAIGFVQVFRHGEWQSVCGHGWDKEDARVVCQQLGYDRGVDFHVRDTGVDDLADPVWQEEITCTDEDTSLDLCKTRGFRGKCKAAPISCDSRNSSLPDGEVRLVDGTTPYSGRVEVSYGGLWGALCDRSWDDTSAGAVCSMLGFTEGGTSVKFSNFGPGFEWFYDDVRCSGSDKSIQDCLNRGYKDGSCYITRTAGVVCLQEYTSNLTGQLRLSGSEALNKGFLEVNYYGVWGTICNTNWEEKDARVACQQMGFFSGTLSTEVFKTQSGPIWLDRVECQGNESSISNCEFNGWYDQWCNHEKDVRIECLATDTALDVIEGMPLPTTMVAYIVVAATVPVILVAIVAVVIIKRKRKRFLVHKKAEVTLSENNKAYNLDTSFFMSSGQHKDKTTGGQYTYIAGDPNRKATSGVYDYILDDGPVYLDLSDDDCLKSSTDNNAASVKRAQTPLPDLPTEANIQDDSYLTTVAPSIDDDYLKPLSERQMNDDAYLQPISQHPVDNACVRPKSDRQVEDDAYLKPISERPNYHDDAFLIFNQAPKHLANSFCIDKAPHLSRNDYNTNQRNHDVLDTKIPLDDKEHRFGEDANWEDVTIPVDNGSVLVGRDSDLDVVIHADPSVDDTDNTCNGSAKHL